MTVCVYLYKHHLYTYILVWTWCLRSSCECNSLNLWAAFLCVVYINTSCSSMAGAFVQSAFQYMCPVLCRLYRYIIALYREQCLHHKDYNERVRMWNIPVQWVGANCFSIRVSISIQTQKWEIWDTHFGSLECPPSHIYRKDVRKVFYISVLGFFCYLSDLPCPFTFLGSTTMRRMSSYESSGVDFFWILFHQYSRLLQFALDDRTEK